MYHIYLQLKSWSGVVESAKAEWEQQYESGIECQVDIIRYIHAFQAFRASLAVDDRRMFQFLQGHSSRTIINRNFSLALAYGVGGLSEVEES